MTTRHTPGKTAPDFTWPDVHGNPITLSDVAASGPVLLSSYRFAACPFCNLHMHNLLEIYPELHAHNLRILAFFQSPADVMLRNVGRQKPPFPLLPDPDCTIYDRYGVEHSGLGMLRAMTRVSQIASFLKLGFRPNEIDGDSTLLPADFLILPDLTLHTTYYATDIGDHLPLQRVLAFAREHAPLTASA